jgi:hypothetical protein
MKKKVTKVKNTGVVFFLSKCNYYCKYVATTIIYIPINQLLRYQPLSKVAMMIGVLLNQVMIKDQIFYQTSKKKPVLLFTLILVFLQLLFIMRCYLILFLIILLHVLIIVLVFILIPFHCHHKINKHGSW